MRKSEINGVITELLNVYKDKNPLDYSDNVGNIEVNLLKKEIDYPLHDDVYEFYKKKMEWFNERIDRFGGRPGFQIAKLFVVGKTEKVEIVFMNDTFLGELKHEKVNVPIVVAEPIKPVEEIEEPVTVVEEVKPQKKRGKKK